MSPKPTPEALHKMGLEYGDNGLIQKIGIKVHPDVQAAEDAATNKPKHIDQVEGYVDEPYQEDFNQEPLVIKFDGDVNGDEWAKKNEMAIADLVGAIESKIGPATEQSESNVSGLLNKNMTVLFNANHESGFNSELVKAGPINYEPTTGFDIETEPAADSFQSALAFGKQEAVKPAKRTVKPKGSKSTTLKKNEDLFVENSPENTFTLPEDDTHTKSARCYVGIDPGKSGGIVALSVRGVVIDKMPIPILGENLDVSAMFELFKSLKERFDLCVILEDVHSIFGMSASTNFTFGYVCGAIEAVILCLKLKLVKVAPKTWQKEIWSNGDKVLKPKKPGQANASTDTKATSLCAVVRLFPNEDLRKSARSKNAADGIVDALLLAEYGRRKNL